MKTKLLLALLIFSQFVFAQTTISDGEEVSGTWNMSGSPYVVEGEAIVPIGATLTIKPGVVVKFKVGKEQDYRLGDNLNPYFDKGFLRVKGTLIAKGKKKKPIIFTHAEKYGHWGIIFFENSKDNHLQYCQIEFAYNIRSITKDDNGTGATSFYKSSGIVENCVYVDNGWTAFNCKQNSNIIFRNNTVIRNQYGIECNSSSVPKITNTIIYDNDEAFYINGGSRPHISNCLIQDSYFPDGAIDKGDNIFSKDPKLDGEFKLKSGSPCKKAGAKGKNIGAY